MGLSLDTVAGPNGLVDRVWTAVCDAPVDFTSIASVRPGIAFSRIDGQLRVSLRGPETCATTMLCPPEAEFFGVDLRLGAHVRGHPPAGLRDLNDAVLPMVSDDRFLLAGETWEVPRPDNVDVLVERLVRAGLVAFDPVVEDLRHGTVPGLAERTAQHRFVGAVGISRRTVLAVERAREAARLLRAGTPIDAVVGLAGYYDQPHLTRSVRRFVGRTPAELAGDVGFIDL